MIRKTDRIVITFYTTTDAMAMEQVCREIHAAGRIIPVPGHISADCGLAWCAPPDSENDLRDLMQKHHLRFQDIHRCLV